MSVYRTYAEVVRVARCAHSKNFKQKGLKFIREDAMDNTSEARQPRNVDIIYCVE